MKRTNKSYPIKTQINQYINKSLRDNTVVTCRSLTRGAGGYRPAQAREFETVAWRLPLLPSSPHSPDEAQLRI